MIGLAIWAIALLVIGAIVEGRTTRRVVERLGESLQATATIGEADLALVRGELSFEQLALRRSDTLGSLSLDVGEATCELPPLGLALVDRACRDLEVRGLRLEVSTTALFRLQRPKRPPLRAERVVIDDAVLVFAPSAFLPSLGKIEIQIEHAIAGPTTFRSPLSFLLSLEELRARLALPAGLAVHLTYAGGILGVSGSIFGSTPVRLPVTLPVAEAASDARAELQRLVAFGKDVAERLVAQRAEDWLRSKLR